MQQHSIQPIEILLIEDSPSDAQLTIRSLKNSKLANQIHWVEDGEAAMDYLYSQGDYRESARPGLILLDLNLPGMNGREVLQAVKADPNLRDIPIIILTTSENQSDINFAYQANANCYVTKPVSIEQFTAVIQLISDFWLSIVKLAKN